MIKSGKKRLEKMRGPVEDEAECSPEKKAKTFCCQTFRKELKKSDGLKSLKKFVIDAKKSDTIIHEYFEAGGSLLEILSLIDETASGDLTTALPVFETVHLILLVFQSSDSKYHQECMDASRIILGSHLLTIKAMLSMNVSKQKKVALKLLTALVTLHTSFAREIMNAMSLTPTLISDLIIPSTEEKSVRKYFILFLLSFLIDGNLIILKTILDKKEFLSSIFPGLKFDDASTVNMTLSLLEEKILKNIKIPKTLKLKLFNTQVIKSLFDLFDWKGPQGTKQLVAMKKNKVKEVVVNQKEKELVVDSVHSFLLILCCSTKFGIAFGDKSLGTSDQLSNKLILSVFEGLSNPLKNSKIADIIIKTLVTCPDLIKPVLNKLEPSFQPRSSKNWFEAMDFAENLIKLTDVPTMIKSDSEITTTNQIIKVTKILCTPNAFLRVVKSGTQKPQPIDVRLTSLKLLNTMWSEVEKVMAAFPKSKTELKKSSLHTLSYFLPDAWDLVELWHNLCDTQFLSSSPVPLEKRSLFLSVVLASLQVSVECQQDVVISPFSLTSDLLKHIELIKTKVDNTEYREIQMKILKFVEVDLESLTPNMELFGISLHILLESTDNYSLSHASKILASSGVFKNNPSEIDVWLLCYSYISLDCRSSVVDCLIESVQRFFNKNAAGLSDDVSSNLSPLIFECIETLKTSTSKTIIFQQYICDVLIHLQHYYTVDAFLYDNFKSAKKFLSKSTINYLKCWKEYTLSSSPEVFSFSQEAEVISWLLTESDSRNVKEIISKEKLSTLELHSLFRCVVAHLVIKTINGDLNISDSDKYSDSLLFLMRTEEIDDSIDTDVVSHDLDNQKTFYVNCLKCLYLNQHLLNSFNIFRKKNAAVLSSSTILLRVLMENKTMTNLYSFKSLAQSWKLRFLDQIKSKLKKNTSLDGVDNLDVVLNFFDYDHSDVKDLISLLSESDSGLFVKGTKATTWTEILMKFAKMHSVKEELNEAGMKRLCFIIKDLSQKGCADVEELENCLVYLLKSHPQHLMLIENDFLKILLVRSTSTNCTSTTITLSKLLLNDPNNVKLFLKILTKSIQKVQEPKLVFSLLSTLIININPFLEALISKKACLVWKVSEISETKSPTIFSAMSVVYKRFQKPILAAVMGGKEEAVLDNINIVRILLRYFVGEGDVKPLKKKIVEGEFHPALLFEAVKKVNSKSITEAFFQGLLKLFCRTLNNPNEDEDMWENYCLIVSDLIGLNFKVDLKLKEWKEFVKLGLGFCFSSGKHPALLKTLQLLIHKLYQSEEESKDLSLFFQMLISHSQFLSVILGKSSLKSELVELFYSLIEKNPSEMSPKHVPILLASYSASLSPCDITLLKILRLYEKNKVNVSDYEPFVWGESAVSHYSIGKNPGLSLWHRFSMRNVLDLLDSQKMEASIADFPISRGLEENQNEYNPNVYDPAFLLPLFVNLLSPGSVVYHMKFINRGGLGYTVRALSSDCKEVRFVASVVLTRFYNHLEISRNLKQKLIWIHFINCIRYNIENISTYSLPSITSLFFAKMTLELSGPPTEVYQPLQNFLLAKSQFTFQTVPEFFPLFHSSEVHHRKHREWLLTVLRDGTKTNSDLGLMFHTMIFKVMFCFFQSQLCDNETKKLVLQVLEKVMSLKKSILLISEYGLLNFVYSIDSNSYPVILNNLVRLLSASVSAIIKDMTVYKLKLTNNLHLVQVLNIGIKLLPALGSTKCIDSFRILLKIFLDCFLFLFKRKDFCWFQKNKARIKDIVDVGVAVLGEKFDCKKFCKVSFYFRDYDEDFTSEVFQDLKNLVFIFKIVAEAEQE